MIHRILPVTLVMAASPAYACGGFFCRTEPIDQAGESIVFAVNEPNQRIEAHVQITYEGDADDFSWVVPVPSIPELFTSSENLFTALAGSTAPIFRPIYLTEGVCDQPADTWDSWGSYESDSFGWFADTGVAGDSGDSGSPPPVLVLAQQRVGPYDTVTLQAASDADLLNWLNTNGYQVPTTLGPALAPYLNQGMLLLALRLANDASAGDLVPLGMRYDGTQPMIPIQLTRIAALDDMRMDVWIFGPERAVPLNQPHVTVNHGAIDWTRSGSNYRGLVSDAVDQAGGKAWVTDVAGAAWAYQGQILPVDIDVTQLYGLTDAADFVGQLSWLGLLGTQQLLDVLSLYVPMPASVAQRGVSERDFYNCIRCYLRPGEVVVFDPVVAADAIETNVVAPMRHAESLFSDHAYMTRVSTLISPGEMTQDPVFGFNPDLPTVAALRTANIVTECDPSVVRTDAPRRLDMSDGFSFCLPSTNEVDAAYSAASGWSLGFDSAHAYHVGNLGLPAAALIEQMGTSGPPMLLSDNRGTNYPSCSDADTGAPDTDADTGVDPDTDDSDADTDTDDSALFFDTSDTDVVLVETSDTSDTAVVLVETSDTADSDDSDPDTDTVDTPDDTDTVDTPDDTDTVDTPDDTVPDDTPPEDTGGDEDDTGCGCDNGTGGAMWLALLPLVAVRRRR
jgi:hypothetical protein